MRRQQSLWRVAMAVTVVVAGCSIDKTSDSTTTSESNPTSSTAGAAPSLAPVELQLLGPVGERHTYVDLVTPQPLVAPPVEQEIDALRQRRDAIVRREFVDADDPFTRVNEAAPTRFMQLTIDVARRRALNPLRVARSAALVSVAAHHAAVGAERAGVVDSRAVPSSVESAFGDPIASVGTSFFEAPASKFPPELVTASAQAKVGCALFVPECPRFERLLALATDRAVASGKVWPSLIDAAVQFGAALGQQVVDLGKADGATPWSPGKPAAPEGGTWVPTPGMYAPALEPGAPLWKTWNIVNGSQFRPDPPPQPGSAEFTAAVEQVKAVGTNLRERELRVARFWDLAPGTSSPPGYWLNDAAAEALRSLSIADQATTLAMTATSMMDAAIACWDSKYTYLLVRPVTEIQKTTPGWMPSIVTPPFPAYVSGHSTFSAAAAVVLATLLPDRAEELLNAAAEAGDSRVYGGIHYWFDDMAGAVLGEKIADETLRKYGLELPTFAGPAQRLHFQNADARTQS